MSTILWPAPADSAAMLIYLPDLSHLYVLHAAQPMNLAVLLWQCGFWQRGFRTYK